MDFQGIAIKKDDDKTIVLVLNIEKLAETIVVRGIDTMMMRKSKNL